MLTLRQTLAIVTGNVHPPWHASDLPKAFKGALIPVGVLRPLMAAVSEQRVLIFVKVRPLSILQNSSSEEDLKSRWASNPVSDLDLKNAIDELFGILSPSGASIVYVAKDLQTVAISGTIASLVSIRSINLNSQKNDGFRDIATGLGGGAGVMIALASSTTAVGTIFVVGAILGFAASFAILGLGILELFAAFSQSSSTTSSSGSGTSSTGGSPVLGESPAEITRELELILLGIDLTSVPEPGELPGAGDLPGGSGDPGIVDGGLGWVTFRPRL